MPHPEPLSSVPLKPRILFVEHQAALRDHMARVLSEEYVVETAANVDEALRSVMHTTPALVVTGIMPGLDGFELLRALRSRRRTETIPVLLIAEPAMHEQQIEGLKEGADGYLAKPYTERELRARIGSLLRSARRHAEAARRRLENEALAGRAALLESITDAFYALDREFRFTYVNQRALDHFGKPLRALLGRVIWEAFPATRGGVFQLEYERAMREHCSVAFEAASLITGRWVDVRAYPTPQGLAAYFRDISARKDAEERLREADQRKTEFLAILAHELRNPLAPLRNGLNILKLRSSPDPTLSPIVSMMDRQLSHLVRLVDDLLDVNRITRGRFELRREKVLLAAILASSMEASRALLEERQHELVADLRAPEILVDGDPDRLEQVFSNLLSNSAKYTDRGGRIALTLERDGDQAVVAVQDNGAGIPPSALEQIFEMFAQVRSDGQRGTVGLGIGLSLVRALVEMHGGSVRAFSQGLGTGSRFTVRLPIAAGSIAGTSATDRPAAAAQQMRVLVVDDNEDAASSLAMLLQLEGHSVRTAADGETAIEEARVFDPDIIFMDLGMPRVDGIEAARRIRSLPRGQEVRVVALTGWGQEADRERTREARMDHHMTKPVSLEALREVLGALRGAASS